jgi:hypothetical protein
VIVTEEPLNRRASKYGRLALFGVALVAYILLAHDERHHWHEWRYLYSATYYSIDQLRDGLFDPGPPPERSAEEVGAWYWGQLLHESLLAAIVKPFGPGLVSVMVAEWVYGLWIPLTALFSFLTLRKLDLQVEPSRLAVLVLLSPLGTYLGFKLMAEGPALALASAAIWIFTEAVSKRGAVWLGLLCLSAMLTALAFSTMVYLPLTVLGFLFAWALCLARGTGIARWMAPLLVLLMSAALSFLFAGLFYGLGLHDYWKMYGFYRLYRKSIAVSLFGVFTAWSVLYCFLFLGLMSARKKALVFFTLWLAISLVPLIVLSANYLESRFLTVGLIPLAGLSLLGFDWIAERLSRAIQRVTAATLSWILVLTTVPLISWGTLLFLPFEMNSGELRESVVRIRQQDPDAAILVPWNYTDFHYLRVSFPNAPVFLVQAAVKEGNEIAEDSIWRERRQRTYGERFISDATALDDRLGSRTLYYVGHGVLPPFQNLKAVASALGLQGVSSQVDRLNPVNHVTHSWMWQNPRFLFHEETAIGNYKVYRVERRTN